MGGGACGRAFSAQCAATHVAPVAIRDCVGECGERSEEQTGCGCGTRPLSACACTTSSGTYVRHRQPGSPHTGAVTAQPRHCHGATAHASDSAP